MDEYYQVHNINEAINALIDESKPFPPALLYTFSDLNTDDIRILKAAWPSVPLMRRRTLLEDLIDMAERDNLMMFEEVGKIALEDEDADVLVSAIDLLFQAEDSRLIPTFLRLLQNASLNERVRAAAANALGPYIYLGEVEKIRPELLQNIVEVLLNVYANDLSDLVRRRVLESLGYSSHAAVPELLRAAYFRPEVAWQESAMFAMGKSADDQWQSFVLANLEHENLKVRLQAIHAAGELTLYAARQTLLRMLNQEYKNEELRHELVWALSQIGGEGIEAAFYRLMDRIDDEEELTLIEDALDELNFTNDKSIFELMDIDIDAGLIPDDEDDETHAEHEAFEVTDEEISGPHFLSEGYDPDEWQRYVDDDDWDDDLDDLDEDDDDFDEDEYE
ncbi:MAG TPA: HEAT repeat domain-containing protein [Anaerolineaceae bacterium]|nr:HEAT repeat domain-containing protein [Anaerolineaceae bacterium]